MSKGSEFREAVEAEFEDLDDPTVRALLDQLVAILDEVEMLEEAVRAEGVAVEGARGQRIAHPALGALVKHRTLFAKLAAELFPDQRHETRSQKAARASRTRWANQKRGA